MQVEVRDGRPGVAGGLTTGEAAAYLGFSRSTLRRAAVEGKLRAKATPGGHLRFEAADLEKFAATLLLHQVDADAAAAGISGDNGSGGLDADA